ncbi:hypothetical protein BJX68DRAFT_224320 [Aspergillus pseudodeflectus]|uniref:F-box domain-containing protein n=1 Tax=Aspergillus pseudodeflectus TaxID=176178 RepID=A0ABR4L6I5_9EURO
MHQPVSFQLLPSELQCAIIRYLDPIALISTSQTNRHFRNIINPRKIHFIERLLDLECIEEIGGPEISFSRLGTLTPDRTSREWGLNRWACTACLRLLPYQCFTNKAISQLAYRKPIRGSPAARKCTSWEPTHPRTPRTKSAPQHTHKEIRDKEEQGEESFALRARYAITTTQNWGAHRIWDSHSDDAFQLLTARQIHFQDAGLVEFQDMDVHTFASLTEAEENAILDREARAVEMVRTGYNRHQRRCLECRFRRGEFRGCSGAGRGVGTPNVPIVTGRQEWFGTVVDRYFPGVSDALDIERPPFNAPVFVIHRENAVERPWTLYRVRCRGCTRWQELRAFRFGGIYPRWEPRAMPHADWYYNWDGAPVKVEVLEKLQCNRCFVAQHGRESLGDGLVKWLASLINDQLIEVTNNLRAGFNHLICRFGRTSKADKAETKRLVWDLRPLLNKNSLDVTRMDVALLRLRRIAWLDLFPGVKDGEHEGHGLWFEPDHFFWQWVELYEESEAIWFWLKGLRDEIQEDDKAERLADWALARDEFLHS